MKVKNKTTAVLLAIFLSFWAWVYTYKHDHQKFWIGLIISVGLSFTLIAPLLVWIWSIVDTASKDEKFYKKYYKK